MLVEQGSKNKMREATSEKLDINKLEESVSFVIVRYEGSFFPSLVLRLKKKTIEVKCLVKTGLFNWKWPFTPDLHDYPPEDINAIIKQPCRANNWDHFSIPEIDHL